MEIALVVMLLVIGGVTGGLIVAAWAVDRPERPEADLQYFSDTDLEQRSRRHQ